MKATLSNHRQSVRKTKLLADLVRGKNVRDIRQVLSYTDKKAAAAFKKLIDSAVANARTTGVAEENLYIKEVTVNKGTEFQRYMPRARGRASGITRGASHISVVLGAKGGIPAPQGTETAGKAPKKVAKKAVKKTAKKASK